MSDMRVKSLDLRNPFIIAASPATHGEWAVLKSAQAMPGAVTMRNYRHGAGGGSLNLATPADILAGKDAIQIHGLGNQVKDPYKSLEEYCASVARVRREMPPEVRLWVSVGHFQDAVAPGVAWEQKWTEETVEIQKAGADALEVHFNTPGVAVARGRVYDFYRLIYNTTRMIKQVAKVPVMVKLPVESCDPLRAMEAAAQGGADAVGPTARWKGFVMDLDWRRSVARPGGGYGGTQALPVACYTVAEARLEGLALPFYAGGGVFSWQAAAKLVMAGSQGVQLGSLACCLGPRAVSQVIREFEQWMDATGYRDIESLCGAALELFTMPRERAAERSHRLGTAYQKTTPNPAICDGCGNCMEACWYDAIRMVEGLPIKGAKCIGCGYCFQVCPTGALTVPAADIVAGVF
jgi:dihydroorotate dehydrogenase/Pyruvate/2-oxoacid:ferredoxin oxidoreductase delta subunit